MIANRTANIAATLLIATALGIAGTFAWQERHSTTPVAASGPQPASYAAAPLTASGAIDSPAGEAIVDTSLHVAGWALDSDGIRSVEIRIDGRPYEARYGIARPDVAASKRDFPNSAAAGFEFDGDFPDLDPVRHSVSVVAISRAGRETVLGTRSSDSSARDESVAGSARHPSVAGASRFHFLMMTSGVAAGGASESRVRVSKLLVGYHGVGTAVPILYLRTTKGASADWEFDPDFDLTRKCKERPVAEDNLHGVIDTQSTSACRSNSFSTAASGPMRAAIRRSGTSTTTWNRTSTIANGRRTTRYFPTTI